MDKPYMLATFASFGGTTVANSDKLAEVVAMLVVRDEDYKPLREAAKPNGDEPVWALSSLKACL